MPGASLLFILQQTFGVTGSAPQETSVCIGVVLNRIALYLTLIDFPGQHPMEYLSYLARLKSAAC